MDSTAEHQDGQADQSVEAMSHNPADTNCVRNEGLSAKGNKCPICANYDNAVWLTQREVFVKDQFGTPRVEPICGCICYNCRHGKCCMGAYCG